MTQIVPGTVGDRSRVDAVDTQARMAEVLVVVGCLLTTSAAFSLAPLMYIGGDRPFQFGRPAPTVLLLAQGERPPKPARVAAAFARQPTLRRAAGAITLVAVVAALLTRMRHRMWIYGCVTCICTLLVLLQIAGVVFMLA